MGTRHEVVGYESLCQQGVGAHTALEILKYCLEVKDPLIDRSGGLYLVRGQTFAPRGVNRCWRVGHEVTHVIARSAGVAVKGGLGDGHFLADDAQRGCGLAALD